MSTTLKELFDEHGSVWLAFSTKPHEKRFKPLGFSEDGNNLIGEDTRGSATSFGINLVNFCPYVVKEQIYEYALVADYLHDDGEVLRRKFMLLTEKEYEEFMKVCKGAKVVKLRGPL